MWLFLLLLVPTVILIVGVVLGKGKITLKEFLVEQGAMIGVILIGYFIARWQAISDTEIWNGWLVRATHYEEWWERVPCSHAQYDSKGNFTGFAHAYDVVFHPQYWEAVTSNSEAVNTDSAYFERATQLFGNREYVHVFRPSKHAGPGNKYVASYVAGKSELIPTAVEHGYDNYIKASPATVLRRLGQGNKFDALIPQYPRANTWLEAPRILCAGVSLSDMKAWNDELAKINARLGAKKQVNIIVIVVNAADSAYVHSLEEKWLGGKKNDFVVIVGCTKYPKIDWVRAMSWSRSEDLKVELRDVMQDVGTLGKRDEILKIIEAKVDAKFVRREMAEFEYLVASWQPSPWATIILLVLGIGGSIALTLYFTRADPFGDRWNTFERGGGRLW